MSKPATTTSLQRSVFEMSRAMEFFTADELLMQIGFSSAYWPLALIKEMIDNSLDCCEKSKIAPVIEITIEQDAITVTDNGPGIPESTLIRSLDYMVRVSDKSHYISPTRGRLGNALKCIWAAPFVKDGSRGLVEVTANGIKHSIEITLNRITQQPVINRNPVPAIVKPGTSIKMYWPDVAGYLSAMLWPNFYNESIIHGVVSLVLNYAIFNPHAKFICNNFSKCYEFRPSDQNWKKWSPQDFTSPHWYTVEKLSALIAGYLSEETTSGKMKTVREFVSEFDGLTGTEKQRIVTERAGLSRAYLNTLTDGNDISRQKVAALLTTMKAEARQVPPKRLGVIGDDHLIKSLNANNRFHYKKIEGTTSTGIPFVLEVAFWVYADQSANNSFRKYIGVNWTPALKQPFPILDSILSKECHLDDNDPVILVVHLACPRLDFSNRSKSSSALPKEISEALTKALKAVTKQFASIKKRISRQDRLHKDQLERLRKKENSENLTIKDSAWKVMEEAYLEASENKKYVGIARMIMYAARRRIKNMPGGTCWSDKHSDRFIQHLLPDFIKENPELCADWDVVWDSRGHLIEPHKKFDQRYSVDLGGLPVRKYMQDWQDGTHKDVGIAIPSRYPTIGPDNRYQAVLFIEKEGFHELLLSSGLLEKYDIALMSTKGVSNVATRQLIDKLSAKNIPTLVVHDFDKSGFTILDTLQSDTRRYEFTVKPNVIDLGLRLSDVRELGLESEIVEYSSKDPREYLRKCGATDEECNFLVREKKKTDDGWEGERVELNAMLSAGHFLKWLEGKLLAHGIKKVVPDQDVLERAYRRACKLQIVQAEIDKLMKDFDGHTIETPSALTELILRQTKDESRSWDSAIWDLVANQLKQDQQ